MWYLVHVLLFLSCSQKSLVRYWWATAAVFLLKMWWKGWSSFMSLTFSSTRCSQPKYLPRVLPQDATHTKWLAVGLCRHWRVRPLYLHHDSASLCQPMPYPTSWRFRAINVNNFTNWLPAFDENSSLGPAILRVIDVHNEQQVKLRMVKDAPPDEPFSTGRHPFLPMFSSKYRGPGINKILKASLIFLISWEFKIPNATHPKK